MRESLGLRKRQISRDTRERGSDAHSCLEMLFDDYSVLSNEPVSERKLAKVRDRLLDAGFPTFKDSDINYALHSPYAKGDADLAFELLDIVENADAGKLEPYCAETRLEGANNNNGVTCYLDSTLFAMFARLEDFEAMLYHTFTDPARRRLVVLLRLWVNMLRTGKLITTSLMAQLQASLAECGWADAALKQQQDASEAFNFITDVLDLPRLTLKKDMYHQGKADHDDHKYTNERTIDVGIPEPQDGKIVTLEDCLLEYFDERVIVERQREGGTRRNTIASGKDSIPTKSDADVEKTLKALHVEITEVASSQPATPTDTVPVLAARPHLAQQGRTPSIFEDKVAKSPSRQNSLPNPAGRTRSNTAAKTVKMPAFQFFRLIPWYTEANPNTDLQVAQHFETKRPTVGICLKRFGQKSDGSFYKRKEKIDIPLETGIPEFLHDDDFSEQRFPNHKFKLSLQSIICHRGEAIQRGHYISFVRAGRPRGTAPMDDPQSSLAQTGDPWLRFDDLAKAKVQYVDIKQELEAECPYLLFYKIVLRQQSDRPGRVSMDGRPPSYTSERPDHTDPLRTTVSTPTLQHSSRRSSVLLSPTHSIEQTDNGDTENDKRQSHDEASDRPVGAPVVVALDDVDDESARKRKSRSPRTSTSGNSGVSSLGRSIGTIFKSRASSSRRGSVVRNSSPGVDQLRPADGTDLLAVKDRRSLAIERDAVLQVPESEGVEPDPRSQKSTGVEAANAEVGVKPDRGQYKRESRFGGRGASNRDKADRECAVM